MPSAPKNLDKKILYKNPKNLSATEKVVTTATVLNNFLIVVLLFYYVYLQISGIIPFVNKRKKITYNLI